MNRKKLARHTALATKIASRWWARFTWTDELYVVLGRVLIESNRLLNRATREYTARHVPETGVFMDSEDMLVTHTVPKHETP